MNIFINDNMFKCRVCVTHQAIKDGMKNQTFNMSFNGILFFMTTHSQQSFWMYECINPLDIIFIDGDVITEIHPMCPPCEDESGCIQYSGFGDQVLEIVGGDCQRLGIKVGDLIKRSMY